MTEVNDNKESVKSSVDRLRVPREQLQHVRDAMSNCSFKRWRRRPLTSEWYRQKSRPDEVAVVTEGTGYLVVNWPRGKQPTILASELEETPLVFPTLEDAMLFGEAKCLDVAEASLARWVSVSGKWPAS